MGLYDLESLLYQIKNDDTLNEQFRDDREAVIGVLGGRLSDEEQRWVRSGDVLAMYRSGVHPVLLSSVMSAFGFAAPDFRRLLAPAKGERKS